MEPGLWPPGSCNLVLSLSFKSRKRSSVSLESCAGMKSLQPSSKGIHSQLGTGGGGGCQLPVSPSAAQGRAELLRAPRNS